MGPSVTDSSKSVNVKVKILNYNLGPLVMFCKLCPEACKLGKSLNEKPVALEAEVNRRERSGPVLVIPDGWYLNTSQHPHPSLALRLKVQRMWAP